ncbi:MAG: PAS domain S-box protein [Spirochaetes bacterium]|nr:PAS domain S-box protein [Spirochaetota bacterium]
MTANRRTILLVEDEILIALEEERKLRTFGYEVIVKHGCDEAVDAAAEEEIDLVLVDIDLGGETGGAETARRILSARDIPVMFIISHAARDMVERIRAITPYGYVIKNSGDFVLRSSIDMALELHGERKKSEECENRYNGLLLNLDAGVVIHGPDTAIIMNNPKASELLGLTVEEMKGMLANDPRWRFVAEDSTPLPLNDYPVNRIASSGNSLKNQVMGVLKTGSDDTTWLIVNGFPVTDADGITAEIIVSFIDITEQKRTEENLKFSEEKFLKSFMMSPAALCIARLKDFKIIEINDTLIKRSGFSRDEIIDKTAPELLMWDNPENRQEAVRALLTEGKITGKEYAFRMRDRSIIIGEYSAFIVTIGGEKHILVTILDITERKRVENELRRSEKRFRNLFETMAQGVVYQAPDGSIVAANPAAERILGLSPEELRGRAFLDGRWHAIGDDGSDFPDEEHPSMVALRTGREVRDTVMGICHPITKEQRWLIVNAVPEFHEGETTPFQVYATFTDITERKLAEERIRALLSEKELLLREVHHRIKNNMSTMTSLLSLQADMLKDQSAVNALLEARNRVQSMSTLYDSLYQTENIQQMSIGYYLSTLVERIISLFPAGAAMTIEKRIDNFTMDVKKLLPLGIIVNEIVTNAMKYAFAGRNSGVITVSTSIQGKRATVIIGDNGIGIPEPVDIDHSTGFGLMLVGILAKQIAGTIRIERGGGTRFAIEFNV